LLTPNHPRLADPMVMMFVARETPCNFYTMASWHLFNQGWLTRLAIRLMGAFSVNREGMDRQAIDQAIEILQNAERPLIIFPEGATSRTNDQLMALMEGPSFIARNAAKRRAKQDPDKKVVVHPVGIKYVFSGDIERTCNEVLSRLEQKLTWRPQTDMPLIDRIVKFGNGMLTLKEIEYGITDHHGTLRQRQTRMVNRLLHPLEKEWLGGHQEQGIAIRIKNLRVKIFPELSRNELESSERRRRWRQLEDTYLAQQIDCYPEDYITDCPSVDRILETIEKFEDDLTDRCTIHGHLKAIIDIDQPIEVLSTRTRGESTDPLMDQIRERLETKLKELQSESAMYRG
jgi:1-acyl-sn-glycerol-3-phosphate acyltransferase